MGVRLPSSTNLSTSGGNGIHFRFKIGRRKDWGFKSLLADYKEIMQFERVTSRNWYTHLVTNQTPFGIVGSSPTNTLLLILISFYFRWVTELEYVSHSKCEFYGFDSHLAESGVNELVELPDSESGFNGGSSPSARVFIGYAGLPTSSHKASSKRPTRL